MGTERKFQRRSEHKINLVENWGFGNKDPEKSSCSRAPRLIFPYSGLIFKDLFYRHLVMSVWMSRCDGRRTTTGELPHFSGTSRYC